MELNMVMAILDRDKTGKLESFYHSLQLPMALTVMARGTATTRHLSLYGLMRTEKALVCTVADAEKTRKLMRFAKNELYVDIPGNGIVVSVPIKSVGGGRTMAYLMNQASADSGEKPRMHFSHELIYVILNEGCSDLVMEAARSAGATGGTILSAKGTGEQPSEKFLGISLANEKDVLLIVAEAEKKSEIMKAIIEQAGPKSPAGAVCFSLPVSQVVGLRQVQDEEDN